MLKSGVHPNRYDRRDFSNERTFGSVDPKFFPEEYNADLGISFPDQNAEGLSNACTAYTQSELGQDENGELFDPGFTYENTLAIAGDPPGSPCQIRDSFRETRTRGLKRKQNNSTLVRGAYFDVDRVDGSYAIGLQNAMYQNQLNKRTVSCGTPWFPEWHFVNANGILEVPSKYVWDQNTVGHNWKACGWKTINGKQYVIIKPWTGPLWGDKGYGYLEFSIFDKVMGIQGTFMYIQSNLTPGEVVRVKLDIWQLILQFFLRNPSKLVITMPEAEKPSVSKSQHLYDVSKACIGRDMSPQDVALDSLACVESLRGVYKEAFGEDIAPVLNTADLNKAMEKDSRFQKVYVPEKGDISIAISGTSPLMQHGHVVIRGEFDSMSNDSRDGVWKANYKNEAFVSLFRDQLRFEIVHFRVLGTS